MRELVFPRSEAALIFASWADVESVSGSQGCRKRRIYAPFGRGDTQVVPPGEHKWCHRAHKRDRVRLAFFCKTGCPLFVRCAAVAAGVICLLRHWVDCQKVVPIIGQLAHNGRWLPPLFMMFGAAMVDSVLPSVRGGDHWLAAPGMRRRQTAFRRCDPVR